MDFRNTERKWQKRWENEKIFEPEEKGDKFFLTVPYPYCSGPLHVGHGRTYVIADFLARTRRKFGLNVLWPMGFHISGTPILGISKRIQKEEKYKRMFRDYIKIYIEDENEVNKVLESFKDPANVANFFANVISNDFKSIGLSIDWSRQFNTGEKVYNKFIEWQFLRMKEKNVIVKGAHPLLFCVSCDNAVGEDDIKDGDMDKVVINEFTAIKFKSGDKVFPAATLRPETVFGVTNIWVNPNITYYEAKVGDETWVVSKQAFEKLKYQGKNPEKISEVSGSEYLNKEVEILGKQIPILPAEFVDPENGTGIVYSVPGHAPFDYIALKDLNSEIKPVVIIDIEGYKDVPAKEICEKMDVQSQKDMKKLEQATKEIYKDEFYKGVLNDRCEQFSGLKISKIKDEIKSWLKKENLAINFYETSRKAECRCSGNVIVAILKDQWFLDYTSEEWKKKSKDWLSKIFIYPEKYRKSMLDTVDWLEKRPCARKRGLGTKLPWDKDWLIESLSDSTLYPLFYLIVKHVRDIDPENLKPEFFDYIILEKGSAGDVAKTTGIDKKIIEDIKKSIEYWYPVDIRHTAPPHLTNHLTFYIMHHILLLPEKYWPRGITISEFLAGREGVKMSKSRGNVIPLADIAKKYSADLYRVYVLFSTDITSVADWREKDVINTRSKLQKFWDIASEASNSKLKELDNLDKWLLSRFYSKLKKLPDLVTNFKLRDYVIEIFFEMLNDLDYYLNRKKEYGTIKRILPKWLVALEPIIPHMCEEIWEKFGNKSLVSLEKWPAVDEKFIDPKLDASEELIKQVRSDIRSILKLVKTQPRKIIVFIAPKWKRELIGVVKENLSRGQRDPKEIIDRTMRTELRKYNGDIAKIVSKLIKDEGLIPEIMITEKEEIVAISNAKEFLEKEFGCEIETQSAIGSKDLKALQAMPMKPGILIN